eukprot:scaffold229285_cov33-Tisochrysis_lutea.AAC.2
MASIPALCPAAPGALKCCGGRSGAKICTSKSLASALLRRVSFRRFALSTASRAPRATCAVSHTLRTRWHLATRVTAADFVVRGNMTWASGAVGGLKAPRSPMPSSVPTLPKSSPVRRCLGEEQSVASSKDSCLEACPVLTDASSLLDALERLAHTRAAWEGYRASNLSQNKVDAMERTSEAASARAVLSTSPTTTT